MPHMQPSSVRGLLHPTRTALLVLDVQMRFARAIPEFDDVVTACSRLARVFRLLGLPVVATEQYPQGLGATVPTLLREFEHHEVPDKTVFSAWSCAAAREALRAGGTESVLVCGVETHVCVLQSAAEMLAAGLAVHVAVDAVASRRTSDRDLALARLRDLGAVPTSSEAAAFELVRDARHPQFKELQAMFV